MYIGDIGERGLHHLVYEVVDNSIDEAMAGHAKSITIRLNPDKSITVKDDGRGIPVDVHEQEGISALELVMTRLGAGGKFDKNSYKVSGGLHGVGVSVVNALSDWCKVRVFRNGNIYEQNYRKGVAQHPVQVVGKSDEKGTETTFHPDDSIFTANEYKYDVLASRFRELAYLNRGVSIIISDYSNPEEEGQAPRTNNFHFEGGIKEFVQFINSNRQALHEEPVYIEGYDEASNIPIEIAIQYNSSYNENIHSFVNNINTHEGGTHVIGFKKALTRTLKNYAIQENLLKKIKVDDLSGEDFREGLTAVISVKVPEPQFEGQTKTKLGNSEVAGIVEAMINRQLSYFLEENPNIAKNIVNKIMLAAEARIAAKRAREAVQKKGGFIGGGLPGKLASCSSKDAEKCEVFLVEGDSAGGSAKQARDRNYQAILPLRGKILNVEKSHPSKIYDNEEIRNIILALGVSGVGQEEFNMEKLRYHKVVIMTDADIDGSHIRTLLLTLFYRYFLPLIEAGYIYIASPPLYLVKVGKAQRYCWTETERKLAVDELAGGDESKVNIQRYKGLGEMNPEQLWETTMDPERRILQLVSIESAAQADHLFTVLMGDEVAPRREFIEQNAKYANIDA